MIDYLIDLICQYNVGVHQLIDELPDNNQDVFELLPLLRNDQVFDKEKIESLLDGDTIFYKLSYKSMDENSKGIQLLQEKLGDFDE